MMSELFVIDLANWFKPIIGSRLMMHRKRPAAISTSRVSQRLINAQMVTKITATAIQDSSVMNISP